MLNSHTISISKILLGAALLLTSIADAAPLPAPAESNALLYFDFNSGSPWPDRLADVMPSTPLDIATTFEVKPVGTPGANNAPSGGLLLGAQVGEVKIDWTAIYMSGLFPVKNTETDFKRLGFGLDLSVSSAHPIKLQIESFNAKKQRSGGLETTIEPQTAGSYQHFDLPLAAFKPWGNGQFSATDPYIQFTFIIGGPQWPDQASHQLCLDDFIYTVSPFTAPNGPG